MGVRGSWGAGAGAGAGGGGGAGAAGELFARGDSPSGPKSGAISSGTSNLRCRDLCRFPGLRRWRISGRGSSTATESSSPLESNNPAAFRLSSPNEIRTTPRDNCGRIDCSGTARFKVGSSLATTRCASELGRRLSTARAGSSIISPGSSLSRGAACATASAEARGVGPGSPVRLNSGEAGPGWRGMSAGGVLRPIIFFKKLSI